MVWHLPVKADAISVSLSTDAHKKKGRAVPYLYSNYLKETTKCRLLLWLTKKEGSVTDMSLLVFLLFFLW